MADGSKLRTRRIELRLTQKEVATAVGITTPAVSYAERGKPGVSAQKVAQIAAFLATASPKPLPVPMTAEQLRQRDRERYERDREAQRERCRRYYWQNREAKKAKTKARYAERDHPVRRCVRCDEPATSRRHQYCDACREWSLRRRYRSWKNMSPRQRELKRQRERKREQASTKRRGYGTAHQKLRKEWAPRVEAGGVACFRCGRLIEPGTSWHLGHGDFDRSVYRGPEHGRCNITAANILRRQDQRRSKSRSW